MDAYEFTQLPRDKKKAILNEIVEESAKDQAKLIEEYRKQKYENT